MVDKVLNEKIYKKKMQANESSMQREIPYVIIYNKLPNQNLINLYTKLKLKNKSVLENKKKRKKESEMH